MRITLVMGKISYKDKARIETLRKLGFGYQTIDAKFPGTGERVGSFAQWIKAICKRVDERGSATERKPGRVGSFAQWIKAICKRVDERGSATERKPGSGRTKTAWTEENVTYLNINFNAAPLHHISNELSKIKLTCEDIIYVVNKCGNF